MVDTKILYLVLLLFVVITTLYIISYGVKFDFAGDIPKIQNDVDAVNSMNDMGNMINNVSTSISDIESLLE